MSQRDAGRTMRFLAALAITTFVSRPASAQQPTTPLTSTVTAGVGANAVSGGFGDWRSAFVRGAFVRGSWVVMPEVVVSHQFHDEGTYFGLSATHVINEDWYVFAAAATSRGGFYLPRARAAATVYRKLLASRRLVVNAGTSYHEAKDVHRDVSLSTGAAYYFTAPWILEGGMALNRSNPGSVQGASGYAALTRGREGAYYLVGRVGVAREAYQIVGPSETVTDFHSTTALVSWRRWTSRSVGVTAGVEWYRNPFYHRTGATIGAFWQY
jgi:YaiO family outer membrane protein